MSFLTKNIGISARRLFAITIINAGTLSWYMYFGDFIGSTVVFQHFTTDLSMIDMGKALFFLFAGVSAFGGVFLSKRLSNERFLWIWTLFGVLTSAMTLFFKDEIFIFIFGPLLGIAMGLGFPYSLSLLASHTELEQRGRVAGIMLFETFAFTILAGLVNIQFNLGITGTVATLVILKSTSFIGLALREISPNKKSAYQQLSVSQIRKRENNKTFLMYLFPWILFIINVVLIDHIIWPTLKQDPQIYNALQGGYSYVGTTIAIILAGFLTDRFGRKIPIFVGLAVLGFSSALLGSIISPETAFVHYMSIGIAMGFLMTAYVTIPGDLAEKFHAEKLYAVTIALVLLIYFALGELPQYVGASATAISISWILTTLILLSIVPVFLAKETLKEEKKRKRKYMEYIEKVHKVIDEE